MNLCLSLICVIVVFFIADVIAGSKTGCRVSNLLRVYFILVSLMWNSVEAVNMYLMLIRIFDSNISRFTTKAAAVTWGTGTCCYIPMLTKIMKTVKFISSYEYNFRIIYQVCFIGSCYKGMGWECVVI